MDQRIEDLILELQDMVNNAKAMPLSKDRKVLLSGERIFEILDAIEDNLPKEIRQAKGIVADRDEILAEAKRKEEEVIRQAEARRKVMISESEIVKAAQAQAADIINAAKKKSADMHKAANSYVDDLMARADDSIANFSKEIKKTRQDFKSAMK